MTEGAKRSDLALRVYAIPYAQIGQRARLHAPLFTASFCAAMIMCAPENVPELNSSVRNSTCNMCAVVRDLQYHAFAVLHESHICVKIVCLKVRLHVAIE